MISIPNPTTADETQFRQNLIWAFEQSVAGFNAQTDVSVNNHSNQIVILKAWSGFPIRMVANVATLRDNYLSLTSDTNNAGHFNRMMLHIEDFAQPLPKLYNMTSQEVKDMTYSPLLLALAMGLIQPVVNKADGSVRYCLMSKDAFGNPNPTEVGGDFAEVFNYFSANLKQGTALMNEVNGRLKSDAVTNSQKNMLREKLGKIVSAEVLNGMFKGNMLDKDYQHYNALAAKILDNELKLN